MQPARVGPSYPVPGLDRPGLGVGVNEEWVAAAAAEGFKWEAGGHRSGDVPGYQRRDGSYTNE